MALAAAIACVRREPRVAAAPASDPRRRAPRPRAERLPRRPAELPRRRTKPPRAAGRRLSPRRPAACGRATRPRRRLPPRRLGEAATNREAALPGDAAPPREAAPPRDASPPLGEAALPRDAAPARAANSPLWLAALAFAAAAFTAVLFLLVLELVAGFAMSPIEAALGVTVLPLAALAGAAIPGDDRAKALAGALLIAGGAGALAFLPQPTIAWTIVPQVLAGCGMGLALPAFSDERDIAEAARNLVARHVGIVIVLAILAPVATAQLTTATDRAIFQGAALVLDAQIDPLKKLQLAPVLLDRVDVDSPRAGLARSVEDHRAEFADNAAVYDRLAGRLDDVIVVAVQDAFRTAYLIAGALALLAAALLVSAYRRPAIALAAAAAVAAFLVFVAAHDRAAPASVALQDPCVERDVPQSGGLSGALQAEALRALDRGACQLHTSREEFALALFDPAAGEAVRARARRRPAQRERAALTAGRLARAPSPRRGSRAARARRPCSPDRRAATSRAGAAGSR